MREKIQHPNTTETIIDRIARFFVRELAKIALVAYT